MTAPLRLAEIISARLCHDLSGSIGTVVMSLEMAADGSADMGEALEIAQQAAKALQARLRFIRAAWAMDGAELDADAILGYCIALPQARKLSFRLDQLSGTLCPPMSRGLLNLILLGAEALPRGGTLTLAGDAANGVLMTIDGLHAAWPAEFAAMMNDEAAAWSALRDSRTLQPPLAALILHQSGLKLRFLMSGANPLVPPPVLLTRQ